jgi:hypothetical protein
VARTNLDGFLRPNLVYHPRPSFSLRQQTTAVTATAAVTLTGPGISPGALHTGYRLLWTVSLGFGWKEQNRPHKN